MPTLPQLIDESDAALITSLLQAWKLTLPPHADLAARKAALGETMITLPRVATVWASLTNEERQALITIAGSRGKMPEFLFKQMFGDVRMMGEKKIEQEKPFARPATTAEGLIYRGLVFKSYENTTRGAQTVYVIPDDLMSLLPLQQNAYTEMRARLESEAASAPPSAPLPPDPPDEDEEDEEGDRILLIEEKAVSGARLADTSLIDDMTTLLAYIRLNTPAVSGDFLTTSDAAALRPHWMNGDEGRLRFLFALAFDVDLVEVLAGAVALKRAEAQRWLAAARADQVRALAEAWRGGRHYVDLWRVPGLRVDTTAGTMPSYDPVGVRQTVMALWRRLLPAAAWWTIDSAITLVKHEESYFQRPDGDFDSWYIQDLSGEYLNGFENWDAVEGALLESMLTGALHWLGLLDLAEDGARLNAYGRAFLGFEGWRAAPDPGDKITIDTDGTITVSRKQSRLDRFQIARIAAWVAPASSAGSKPYAYRLDATSVRRAAEQGLNTGHLGQILTKAAGDPKLPPAIAALLDRWKGGAVDAVQLERAVILRTTTPAALDQIYEAPATRQYLGARLGEMAGVVRADKIDALRAALTELGIDVEGSV